VVFKTIGIYVGLCYYFYVFYVFMFFFQNPKSRGFLRFLPCFIRFSYYDSCGRRNRREIHFKRTVITDVKHLIWIVGDNTISLGEFTSTHVDQF